MKTIRIVLVVFLFAASLGSWLWVHTRQPAQNQIPPRPVALLTCVSNSASPVVVRGILAGPNFRKVLRALEDRTGAGSLPEPPVVVTGPRWRAVNQITDTRRYSFSLTNK